MSRHTIAVCAILALMLTATLLSSVPVGAQLSMNNYTAQPISTNSGVLTPNILFVYDASSSMRALAAAEISGDAGLGYWDEDNEYAGYFDSMKCYTYDSANKRFEASGSAKAAIATACASTLWDGNFLNWATLRRFDAAKIAMTGGTCINTTTDQVGNRDADGLCLPSGTPAKKTITALHKWWENSGSIGGHRTTPPVKGPGNPNPYVGRVPSSVQSGTGGNDLYFHIRGGVAGMQGTFCTSTNSSDPSDSATTCDTGEAYTEQQFYIRVVVDTEPQGVIQQVGDKARFGLMMLSKGGPQDGRGWLTVPVGSRQTRDHLGTTLETFKSNEVAMIDAVDEVYHFSGTPAVEALYEAIRYYAQVGESGSTAFHTLGFSPAVALGSTGTGSLGSGEITVLTAGEVCPSGYISDACGRDPVFFGSDHTPPWALPSAQIACCKNYIILLTDGAPNSQSALPSDLKDYGHSVHGSHCCGIDNDDYDLVGLAYWAHIHDLRQSTVPVINETGHDLPGFQNVTVYTFFAFGETDGRDLLQLTAKFGGFEDSDAPGDPGYNKPDKVSEYDKVNNLTGAEGADGIPDTYYESKNANDMKDKLTAIISSILQHSASGTAASVLASSTTGEGAVYQAFFFPSTVEGLKEIKWTGYTQGLFIDAFGNLREDTDGDGRLVYKNDKIIQTRFVSATSDVVVDRFVDVSPADGRADSTTPVESVGLKDIKPIWEAGEQLALMDSSVRKILTWVDDDNDGAVDAGEQIAFKAASPDNSAKLAPYLQAGAAPFTAQNIINFIRGDQVAGLRNRQLTVNGATKVWKLGDPVHSTPTVVGTPRERYDVIYGDASYTDYFLKYKSRRQVAYVGANDGMLHAFNVGFYHKGDDPSTTSEVEHGWFTRTATGNSSGPVLGEELWGFIPQELLPHLKWLTQPDYSHVYYVDLKPKVTDARVFTPDTAHPNGWGTILIGGMRYGGSCGSCTSGAPPMEVTADFGSGTETTRTFYSAYFVLDITDPEQDPVLLWSFSDAGLGLSTSFPAVLRVNPSSSGKTDNTNAKWFVAVGSGPTGYAGESTQTGKIFALEMPKPWAFNTALVMSTFPSSDLNDFMADMVSVDADLDYRADVMYVGNTIKTSSPTWQGKMYRLTTASGDPDPLNWANKLGKVTELLATFTCSPKPCGGPKKVGPITAAPAVTLDDARQLWVFFGTGRYFTAADSLYAETQSFFGVKDPVITGGTGACQETSVQICAMNDLVNVSSATICVVCASGTDQVTGVSGVNTLEGTSTTTLQGLVQSKDGWWTTLPATRERGLVSPTLLGGIVFFPTFAPTADVCASSGDSKLYALFYLTGSAYTESVVGTETVGSNTNVLRSLSLGTGLPSQVALHLGGQGGGVSGTTSGSGCAGQVTGFIQTSSGALSQLCTKPALSWWSRYITWLGQPVI